MTDDEYLTEHWLFQPKKDDFDLFIEECRKRLNEVVENARFERNCKIQKKCNE